MIALLVTGWLLLIVALLFIWSGIHANARAAEGIDEDTYVAGSDDRSLAEFRDEQTHADT